MSESTRVSARVFNSPLMETQTERVTIMLPTETEQNIIAEYEAMINLLLPVIDSPEPDTESFDEDADYAQ